jgi:hypothetical protein
MGRARGGPSLARHAPVTDEGHTALREAGHWPGTRRVLEKCPKRKSPGVAWPSGPRRAAGRGAAEAAPPAPAGVAADGRPDLARLSLEEWRVLSRTPEGAAALAAAREAARGAGSSPPAAPDASTGSGERAPAPEVEAVTPDDADEEGEGEDDDEDEIPEEQDPPQDPPRVVGPASGPGSGPAPRAPSGRRSPCSTRRRTGRMRTTMTPPEPGGRAPSNFPSGSLLLRSSSPRVPHAPMRS